MLTRERKDHILTRLRADRRVVAKEISRELELSEDTIRRDLRELAAEGLLQRVHGGALPVAPAMLGLAERSTLSPEGKAAIGRAAAALVRPGQVVFLDGGTSAVQVARHFAADLAATVVTHSPSVAVALSEYPRITVELIGGRLYKHSMVTTGSVAAGMIAGIQADLYFMGASGIHPELGCTTGDAEEGAIKRLLARQSAETILLASAEKLGAVAPFKVMGLSEVGTMIVEAGLPEETLAPFRKAGPTIIRA
jgi:DeoR/GlpR family transcriptional regulator of sugar metabolism